MLTDRTRSPLSHSIPIVVVCVAHIMRHGRKVVTDTCISVCDATGAVLCSCSAEEQQQRQQQRQRSGHAAATALLCARDGARIAGQHDEEHARVHRRMPALLLAARAYMS